MRRRSPSPAAVIALLALFFALGGSAVAAGRYLITSTGQIKPSVLSRLRGPSLSQLIEVAAPAGSIAPGEVGGSHATCPEGFRAISGGGTGSVAGLATSEMTADHRSWFVLAANTTPIATKIQAFVYCAGEGRAVAASNTAHGRAVREVEADVLRLTTHLRAEMAARR